MDQISVHLQVTFWHFVLHFHLFIGFYILMKVVFLICLTIGETNGND